MAKKKKQHTKRGAQPAPDPKRHVNDWHTMFYGALELILDSKLFSYQFQRSLTKGPLQIDAIIVKKLQDVEPTAKIAKLFLRDNIIEFKGPGDNMSVGDFYKVNAYAHLYRSITEAAPIREITLTFVERPYPEDMIKHFEEELGYTVEKKWPGIYYVTGGQFPVQLIETKALEDAENIWLKHLDNELGAQELVALMQAEYEEGKQEARTRYIQPLAKANMAAVEEVSKMAALTLDEFLEDWAKGRPALLERLAKNNGFIPAAVFAAERQKFAAERIAERQQAEAERVAERQQAEAERATERQKTIQKLNKMGLTDTEIAEFMELDLKTIQTYIAPSV
jgi:hypothetical protein